MTLTDYLTQFKQATQLRLVGPLATTTIDPIEPIIYVDGGSRMRAGNHGISVGDGDSCDVPLDIQLNPQKDYSDLAYVLAHISDNFAQIYLYGFVGGRLDHQLFNLGETHYFLNHRQSPTALFFDNSIACYSAGQWQFTHHGVFSLACLDATKIELSGKVAYPCQPDTDFSTLRSLGLSNVADGKIYLSCNKSVIVLFN